MHHAETALGIGNFLAAKPANLPAHVTVHHPTQQWHRGDVILPRADKNPGAGGCGGGEKTGNLFRQMLAVAVEDKRVIEPAFKPMAESCFDRLALPAVLLMNNHLRACLPRRLRGGVARAVIDDENIIE